MSTPVEQAAVERVAEAIWRADINNGHRDFIAEAGVSWADDIGEIPKRHYRRLAEASIEALQLTEEQRIIRSICDMADPGIPERRLVGPWRTAP